MKILPIITNTNQETSTFTINKPPVSKSFNPQVETQQSRQLAVDEFLSVIEAQIEAQKEEAERIKDDLFSDAFDFNIGDFIEQLVEKLDFSNFFGSKKRKKKPNYSNSDSDSEEATDEQTFSALA